MLRNKPNAKLQTFMPENKSFKGTHIPQKLDFTDLKSTAITMKLHQDIKPNNRSFIRLKNYLPDDKSFESSTDSSPLNSLVPARKFARKTYTIHQPYIPPEIIFSVNKSDFQKNRSAIKTSLNLIKNVTTRVTDLKNQELSTMEAYTCGVVGGVAQTGTSAGISLLLKRYKQEKIEKAGSKIISESGKVIGDLAQEGCRSTFKFSREHAARENPESPFSSEMEDRYKKTVP